MKIVTAFILLATVSAIGAGCSQAQPAPFAYTVKPTDDPCPQGQKMSYAFTGAGTAENGCRNIAADAGKTCSKNDDCINNCLVTWDYLNQLNCVDSQTLCTEDQTCEGIRGLCEAIPGEANFTLPEPNIVYTSCEE